VSAMETKLKKVGLFVNSQDPTGEDGHGKHVGGPDSHVESIYFLGLSRKPLSVGNSVTYARRLIGYLRLSQVSISSKLGCSHPTVHRGFTKGIRNRERVV